MNLLEPGYYKGRILNYGIRKTKAKGDPAPTILFEVTDSAGARHKVYWQGSFNGGGLEIAMEALLVCGLRNARSLQFLADGPSSKLLDMDAFYDLTIEVEVNQEDSSKKYNKVKWINKDGESKFKDAMTPQEFAPVLNQRGLIASLIEIAEKKGYDLQTGTFASKPKTAPASTPVTDDIPF